MTQLSNIMRTISHTANRAVLKVKKYSPEILTVTAIASTVGAVATAIHSTMTMEEKGVLDTFHENKEKLAEVREMLDDTDFMEEKKVDYTEEDYIHDTTINYVQGAWEIVKHYTPTIICTGIAIGSIAGLYKVTKVRYLAAVAAYTSTKAAFEKYREQIKQELRNVDLEEDAVERDIRTEAAEKITEDHVVPCRIGMENHSMYARWFDENCTTWRRDGAQNLLFLKMVQNMANDKLRLRGHIFLNEVYEMIGLPHTREGALVGWVWGSGVGDDYVDFHLFDRANGSARDFINGWEKSVLLDFNVDGVIYDLI